MGRTLTRLSGGLLVALVAGCAEKEADFDGLVNTFGTGEDFKLRAAPAKLEAIATELVSACASDFRGDTAALPFDPAKPGSHKLLFVAADGSAHRLNNIVPVELQPETTAQVELVACVGHLGHVAVDVCEYGPHSIGPSLVEVDLYRQQIEIRVVGLHSGERADQRFLGDEPRCPSQVRGPIVADIVGPPPDLKDIERDLVDRYTRGSECGGARPHRAYLQCWRDAREAREALEGALELEVNLPIAGVGESVALAWDWTSVRDMRATLPPALNLLYAPVMKIDWSASAFATSLSTLEGAETVAALERPGMYTFIAQATLPGPDGDAVLAETRYTFESLAPAEIDALTVPAEMRVGVDMHFTVDVTIESRPEGGRFGEQFRWTWLKKPDGEASMPYGPRWMQSKSWWWLELTTPGTYQLQLEYDNGSGVYSKPMVSAEFIATDKPVVTLGPDREVTGLGSYGFEAKVTHNVSGVVFGWNLLSKPEASNAMVNLVSHPLAHLDLQVDAVGEYVVQVVAADSKGSSAPARTKLTVR